MRKLNNFLLQQQEEEDKEILHILVISNGAILLGRQERKANRPNVDRGQGKVWWRNIKVNWSEKQSSEEFRICRETFNFILSIIQPFIIKVPTNLVPIPIDSEEQLALTLYRLAHGCSFIVISNLFGISKSLGVQTFITVVRELVMNMYNDYIKLPTSDEEWNDEVKGFIENYEFTCIGAWDGFHVYISCKLKNIL